MTGNKKDKKKIFFIFNYILLFNQKKRPSIIKKYMEIEALDWAFVGLAGIILGAAVKLQSSLGNIIEDEANIDYSVKKKSSSKNNKNFLKKRKN
jgi:hypothetical protein